MASTSEDKGENVSGGGVEVKAKGKTDFLANLLTIADKLQKKVNWMIEEHLVNSNQNIEAIHKLSAAQRLIEEAYGLMDEEKIPLRNRGKNTEMEIKPELRYFNTVITFNRVPVGGEFIEAFTTANEVATRIESTTHQDKPVNARRVEGKLIWMEDWEPVFVRPGCIELY